LLPTEDGQVVEAHSVSAGLDYPGVGPELSHLRDARRLEVLAATDAESLEGFRALARSEGILCALESAHAIAALPKLPAEVRDANGATVVVNLSGRGDKDLATIVKALGGARRAAAPTRSRAAAPGWCATRRAATR